MRRLSTALVILGAAGAVAAAGPAVAGDHDATFRILRKGEPIGVHVVDVEPTADGFRVETRISMRVRFGPLPVYRYDHASTEIWRDGVIATIDSRTDDNGKKMTMSLRREGEDLVIAGTGFEGRAPLTATPSSYWNKAVVAATTIVNTQNGELIDVETASLGVSAAPDGQPAEHFRLAGTVALDLWYDGARWVGSNFTIDGEELTYVLESGARDKAHPPTLAGG